MGNKFENWDNQAPKIGKPDIKEEIEVINENEVPEVSELDKKITTAANIKSLDEIREDIKKEKPKKNLEKEKLLFAMKEKLNEMKNEVLKAKEEISKKNFIARMLTSEEDFNKALMAITNYEGLVNGGQLIDLHTVTNSLSLRKFVKKVDISDFPENPNKSYSTPSGPMHNIVGHS